MKDLLDRMQFTLLSGCIVSLVVAVSTENRFVFWVFVVLYVMLLLVVAKRCSLRS